jgi:tetratricopeptide (TPR) repeat protein
MERHTNLDGHLTNYKTDQGKRVRIEEPLNFSLFDVVTSEELGKSSTDLNGRFLYSQLFIETLLYMSPLDPFDQNQLNQLCKNECELAVINEFRKTYSSDRAIWWYSKETFLYRLLNQAFRVHDIHLLYTLRFFICDLYQELEKLHAEQQQLSAMRVYRVQLLAISELVSIENRLGRYMSMNSFLSTTLDYEYAVFLLESSRIHALNTELTSVLFEIEVECVDINIKRTRRTFAEIIQQSAMPDEKEVLFTPGNIFRLTEIIHQKHTSFTIIRMTLCSFTDAPLRSIYEFRQTQLAIQGYNCMTLGKICWQMGRFDQAERFFRQALEDPSFDEALCYRNLANATQERGDYSMTIVWYAKSMKLKKQMSIDVLADTYNSCGVVFHRMGNLRRARQLYNRAMHIWIRAYGRDCEQTADYFNNMGVIYFVKSNYVKALRQYRMSLQIRQKHRPPDHPYTAATQVNIGNIHATLGQFDHALEFYELAFDILRHAVPPEHPIISVTKKNITIITNDDKNTNELQPVLCHFRQM